MNRHREGVAAWHWIDPAARLVLGLAIALWSAPLFRAAAQAYTATIQLRDKGVMTQAIIQEVGRVGFLAVTYPVVYRLEVGQEAITKWEAVTRTLHLIPDTPVTVRYLPDDPAISVIESSRALENTLLSLGMGSVLIGAAVLGLVLSAIPRLRDVALGLRAGQSANPPVRQSAVSLARLSLIIGTLLAGLLGSRTTLDQLAAQLQARYMGVVVEAEIVHRRPGYGRLDLIIYSFEAVGSGQRITQIGLIDQADRKDTTTVRVQYAPLDPQIAAIVGSRDEGFLLFAALMSIGLVSVALALAPRLPRSGEPPGQEMVAQIEALVQLGLARHPDLTGRSIHVRQAEDDSLLIEVNGQTYRHIDAIPDETVRSFLQSIVSFWQAHRH